MYITALLFLNTVSLQFHKLPDATGEEALRLFPNLYRHHFFVTAKPATT
jgi:hypothetical protein